MTVLLFLFFFFYRAFSISDDGEIAVTDVAELNATIVSLTVVARDSGIPPRQVFPSLNDLFI